MQTTLKETRAIKKSNTMTTQVLFIMLINTQVHSSSLSASFLFFCLFHFHHKLKTHLFPMPTISFQHIQRVINVIYLLNIYYASVLTLECSIFDLTLSLHLKPISSTFPQHHSHWMLYFKLLVFTLKYIIG